MIEARRKSYSRGYPALAALALALWLGLPVAAQASLPGVPNAALAGEVEIRILGFKAYDARLYTNGGSAYAVGAPAALALTYRRGFGQGLLTRAVEGELKRVYGEASATADMTALADCIREVKAGDQFVAISRNSADLRVFLNGKETCAIRQEGLPARFLSLWLSDNSRHPDLSRVLRGAS